MMDVLDVIGPHRGFHLVVEYESAATGAPTKSVVYAFSESAVERFISNCIKPSQWMIIWDSADLEDPFTLRRSS